MSTWYFEYLNFARNNLRFLSFGLLLCFTSSAGQTYFIGIFGPGIRAEFSLSHTEWGTLYLIGTLASAIVLPWSGQLLDRVDLRYFVVAVMLGLVIACLSISLTSSALMVAGAVFLLRQFGQGLTSLSGTTPMARYYGPNRGKAISIASVGYSLGEAILPVSAVLAIAMWGWRSTYQVAALSVFFLIPVALWLLRGHGERHTQHLNETSDENENSTDTSHYTRMQVLREKRFYLMMPAVLAPSYIVTAMFFHHLTLAEHKGWSAEWVTGNYWVFALATITASLLVGPMIDRFTAVRIMPLYLLPLIASMIVIGPAESSLWLLLYMALAGINSGIYFAGLNAMWAELYGTKFLGAIKSLMTALTVLASALGPVTVGLMLDNNLTMETVCFCFAGFLRSRHIFVDSWVSEKLRFCPLSLFIAICRLSSSY